MTIMAFESAGSFSPSRFNDAGSGAVGLIQFMPDTADMLGTSTEELAGMTALEQLDYVEKYFVRHKGKLKTLSDMYMAVLWPIAVGKPEDHVIFRRDDPRYPKRYFQNRGLDVNKDGLILKGEAVYRVASVVPHGVKLSCSCNLA